jgi:GNAT superfamily N-acetyltransferase
VIRRAVAADIPDLARVHVEAWRQTYAGHVPDALLAPERVAWRAAMWTAILAGGEGPHLALVAPDDSGAIAALGLFMPASEASAGWDHEIRSLYLLRHVQRRGLGAAMLAQGRDWARARGGRNLMAWALAANAGAQAFYRATGAVEIARREVPAGTAMLAEIGFGWDPV